MPPCAPVPLYIADPIRHALMLLQHGMPVAVVAEALVARGATWRIHALTMPIYAAGWAVAVRLRRALAAQRIGRNVHAPLYKAPRVR